MAMAEMMLEKQRLQTEKYADKNPIKSSVKSSRATDASRKKVEEAKQTPLLDVINNAKDESHVVEEERKTLKEELFAEEMNQKKPEKHRLAASNAYETKTVLSTKNS